MRLYQRTLAYPGRWSTTRAHFANGSELQTKIPASSVPPSGRACTVALPQRSMVALGGASLQDGCIRG